MDQRTEEGARRDAAASGRLRAGQPEHRGAARPVLRRRQAVGSRQGSLARGDAGALHPEEDDHLQHAVRRATAPLDRGAGAGYQIDAGAARAATAIFPPGRRNRDARRAMTPLSVPPSALLVALTLLGAALRPVLLRGRTVPTAAPASVMAIGIFALADLQHLPRISEALRAPLTLFLLALWGPMAAYFLSAAAAGSLREIGRAHVRT